METFFQISIAVLLAGIVSAVAFYKKWLNGGGAVAACFIGAVAWYADTWKTAAPLLFFFVSGSLWSLGNKNSQRVIADAKDDQPRDWIQVVCNGGIAIVCLLLFEIYQNQLFIFGYWASLAISTADTWGSAIGTRFAGKVVDIRNFQPMQAGLSGGVSLLGTIGAAIGSLLIGLTGLLIYRPGFPWLMITLAGFAGMLLDSFLGSLFQAKYQLQNGALLEFEPQDQSARLVHGLGWVNNDLVNLMSNLLITGIVLLLYKLLQYPA